MRIAPLGLDELADPGPAGLGSMRIVGACGPANTELVYGTLALEQFQEWVELVLDAEKAGEEPPGCPACGAEVTTIVTRAMSFAPPYRNSATLMPCECTY